MFYNYGRNYFLGLNSHNLDEFNTNSMLEFLRGYIELHSKIILPISIANYFKNCNYPLMIIYIRKNDNILFERILKLLNNELLINYKIEYKTKIHNKVKYQILIKFDNNNVLNLLAKIYPNNIDKNDVDEYIYSIYLNLSNYRYINYDNENETLQYYMPKCQIQINHPAAIKPSKTNASDIGYSISIINLHKIISKKIRIYDTGLEINPQFGYYYKLEPTSLLSIHGYILGNTIDNEQKNKKLLITLIKIDDEMPDIKLPYMCCILVMKELRHYEIDYTN